MSHLTFNESNFASVDSPWGPGPETPACLTFNGVPYAPFIKSDKLGKIADWQVSNEEELALNNANSNNNYKKRDQYHAYGASAAKMFGAEVEEKGFSLVENSSATASSFAGASTGNKQTILRSGRKNNNNNSNFNTQAKYVKKVAPSDSTKLSQSLKKKPAASTASSKSASLAPWGSAAKASAAPTSPAPWGSSAPVAPVWGTPAVVAPTKFTIKNDWKSVASLKFEQLSNLSSKPIGAEQLGFAGSFAGYSREVFDDKRNTELPGTIKELVYQTSSNDANLNQFAKENKAQVFITHEILAQLMCAPESIASWDIIINKRNGQYFFDKRANTFTLPVNETAEVSEADNDLITKEAADVQSSFLNAVLSDVKSHNFTDLASPVKDKTAIPRAYKYTRIETKYPVVVRTASDCYLPTPGVPLAIHSLLEPKTNDWLTKLHTDGGNLFEQILQDNMNKVQQWVIQAKFSGAETLKLGLISRENVKSAGTHIVGKVLTARVQQFAAMLGLQLDNGWGIYQLILDTIEKQSTEDDATFVLHKPQNEEKIDIYKVPTGSIHL